MASIFISSSAALFNAPGRARRVRGLALAGALTLVCGSGLWSAAPRFYPDDPAWSDDDRAFDASKVVTIEDTNGYDFIVNTFSNRGERRDVRAQNVNTVDEIPDSSWFTNR